MQYACSCEDASCLRAPRAAKYYVRSTWISHDGSIVLHFRCRLKQEKAPLLIGLLFSSKSRRRGNKKPIWCKEPLNVWSAYKEADVCGLYWATSNSESGGETHLVRSEALRPPDAVVVHLYFYRRRKEKNTLLHNVLRLRNFFLSSQDFNGSWSRFY